MSKVTKPGEQKGDKIDNIVGMLMEYEKKKLKEIGELLIEELDVDVKRLGSNENAAAYVRKLVEKIIKNYKIKVSPDALDRLMYYIVRDFVHFDKIDPMMR